MTISLRSTVGYSLQASKWQKCPLLLDANEMKELFSYLEKFWIVQISGLVPRGEEIIHPEAFLDVYSQYIQNLKEGRGVHNSLQRPYFSAILTTCLDALYAVPINETKSLIKIQSPVIQMQAHRFSYSFADGTFRSMTFGSDGIDWGIQFSYPHLYQNDQLEVLTVKENDQFPNTALFKKIQRWVRSHTLATPFEVEGKKINVPIRLGKLAFHWVNRLPQLKEKGLSVVIPNKEDK